MKNHFAVTFTLILFLLYTHNSSAQKSLVLPKMESTPYNFSTQLADGSILNGFGGDRTFLYSSKYVAKAIYQAPYNIDIVDVCENIVNDTPHFYLLMQNGEVKDVNAFKDCQYIYTIGKLIPKPSFEPFLKIIGCGDKMYVETDRRICISKNNGRTWQNDAMTGLDLQSTFIGNIAIDKSQNVYLSAGNGLYMKPANNNSWIKLNIPTLYSENIFVAINGILYYSVNQSVYKSTDDGKNWISDTIGLMHTYSSKFCEDYNGNLYLITHPNESWWAGNRVFRSKNGKWEEIASSIELKNNDPLDVLVIFSLSGKDTLYLGTTLGLFESYDNANTWTASNTQLECKKMHGMVVTKAGTKLISTASGIYYQSKGSSNWIHSYPANSYILGQKLFIDENDVVYTTGKVISTVPIPYYIYFGHFLREVWKSNDQGKTWLVDTAGIYKAINVQNIQFFVDEEGNQYMGGDNGQIFTKRPGNGWQLDGNGIPMGKNIESIGFGSHGKGTIYLEIYDGNNYTIFQRAFGDTKWVKDGMAGLVGNFVLNLLSSPHSFLEPYYILKFDNKNNLYAAYYNSFMGKGVYYTSDSGTSWHRVGGDSVWYEEFVWGNDTMYGVTRYDGVKIFGKELLNYSIKPITEKNNSWWVYPNPAESYFEVAGDEPSPANIQLFNVRGQLLKEETFTGSIKIGINFPGGMYFYRIHSDKNIQTGTLMVK